jgi:hypothetical protein
MPTVNRYVQVKGGGITGSKTGDLVNYSSYVRLAGLVAKLRKTINWYESELMKARAEAHALKKQLMGEHL